MTILTFHFFGPKKWSFKYKSYYSEVNTERKVCIDCEKSAEISILANKIVTQNDDPILSLRSPSKLFIAFVFHFLVIILFLVIIFFSLLSYFSLLSFSRYYLILVIIFFSLLSFSRYYLISRYYLVSRYYPFLVIILFLVFIKKLDLLLMVVSVLLKMKFGHTQISVPKIGIPMLKLGCINPCYCMLLKLFTRYVNKELSLKNSTPKGLNAF